MAEDHEGSDRQKKQGGPALESDSDNASGSSVSLNSEAMAHLQVAWEQFATHVDFLVQSEDQNDRQPVIEDLLRIRNTLVVLEKTASQFVIEELIAVLQLDAGYKSDTGGMARVLLGAVQHLDKHLNHMQEDVDTDNALSLVALVNDCRAYRDEMLLSDALMLAAGIECPEVPSVSVSEAIWSEQRQLWVDYASSIHVSLAQRLLHWWRSDRVGSVGPLIRHLDRIAVFSEEHSYLSSLAPLFQAASLVANAVKDGQIDDGPALRSLFAQLERNVHRCALVAIPDDLVPDDLLRNLLFYVAQIESDTPSAISLRRRFRLDRVRLIAQSVRSTDTPTIGVGYHLTNAIRNGVMHETEYLREWLDEPGIDYVHAKLVRLRVRLGQLEPVLTIMGAAMPLTWLKLIIEQLDLFIKDGNVDESIREQMAHTLLQLDTSLDQSARQSILKNRSVSATTRLSAHDVYVDTATDACLREARNEIQTLATQLIPAVGSNGLARQRGRQIASRVNTINSALQMLPLPELCPVFGSVNLVIRKLTTYSETHALGNPESVKTMLGATLESLDDYLGCVLLPEAAADQFLTRASETLEQLMGVLDIRPDMSVEETVDQLPSQLIERLLDLFAAIGEAIADYRSQPAKAEIERVGRTLTALHEMMDDDAVPFELSRLAGAACVWFSHITSDENATLSSENLVVLDEVQGFLPILLNPSDDGPGQLSAMDELLQRLEREVMDAPDEIFSDVEPLLDDLSLSDIGSLTLNVDDDLLLESLAGEESPHLDLDGTLQLVFQHECIGHLESLDESVRLARTSRDQSDERLPNEKMLRALHTLTGSAQTINAADVVAIVLPLQRASLSLHREGRYFDAEQTDFIGELVAVLRSRLDAIGSGEPSTDTSSELEAKLGEFLSATVPGLGDAEQDAGVALSIGSHIKSLEDVFADESSEILEKLRRVIRRESFDDRSLSEAQTLLHTLKGTARMVGKLSISECAHKVESDLLTIDNAQSQLDALKQGYRSLHGFLLQSTARRMTRPLTDAQPDRVAMHSRANRVSPDLGLDAGSLLDLATDLTVNQVRLSDEFKRMRNACQDIDSTSFRWRKLLQQSDLSDSPATIEILADMEAVCLEMRDALRQAEREQQQASRISANLQQSLMRSRLCRLDDIRDRLSDMVADLATVCGVAVRFELSGGEIMVDKELHKQLAAPLEHLVRNSVVHGIEPAEQRLARGKSSTGLISLTASVDGENLVLRFEDDGRGIDIEALDLMLKARGEAGVENEEQLQNLLLKPGFSTVERADSIAGHGLGLSAVQAAVEQMNGRLLLQTAEGAGIQIILQIPQPLVVKHVVLVKDGERHYGIPVVYVKSVQLSEQDSVADSVRAAEQAPKLSIRQLLGIPDRRTARRGQTSLVSVCVQEQSLQIEIDEIIGYRELVTQPLGAQIASLKCFSDGSVLPAGQKVLVLDIPALLENPPVMEPLSVRRGTELPMPVALIVDDSQTTRRLTGDTLRQWGISVRSSNDGLDALQKIAIEAPDIMIVDLEMPRLDGFGLLRRVAQQAKNSRPAIIVVSHHDNRQHRETAAELGAVRFLVKPCTGPQLHEAIEAAGLRLPDLTIA